MIESLISSFSEQTQQNTKDQLRQIISVLPWDIIKKDSGTFFNIHRLLSHYGCMSLGIRFTVQYNLYAGTILYLGNEEQVSWLMSSHDFGCFALTEQSSGVSSGLVINTNCFYDEKSKTFHLKSRSIDDRKYWISQGTIAMYCVVFANLIIKEKNYGPHAFLINLVELVKKQQVIITNMGEKTVANDLDNASIYFDCYIEQSCLLSKYTKIVDGNYINDGHYSFLTIAIRLLTGRYAIATSALTYYKQILNRFEDIASNREIYITKDTSRKINQLPEYANYMKKCLQLMEKIDKYNTKVEKDIIEHINKNMVFSDQLIDAISISKIISTTIPVVTIPVLRRLLGSQSLIYKNKLHDKELDIFLMCAFAEGSNDLLKQKITRDVMVKLKNSWLFKFQYPIHFYNLLPLLIQLYIRKDKVTTWFDNYEYIITFAHDKILAETDIDLNKLTYTLKSKF